MSSRPQPTYSDVLSAIRLGISKIKGATDVSQEVTASTGLWVTEDSDQPCLDLDSLDLLNLIVLLEEEFGWRIAEEQIDAENWRTVGDLATVLIGIARENPHSQ
jgi:acyl carrier protein